jgi:hypothetical protein
MVKRILSEKERKSKERFNQLLVGLVLIFLMILSTLGYALTGNQEESSSSEKVIYNGLEFVNQNEYWTITINDIPFGFKYNPEEIESTKTNLNDISSYYSQPLYIESDDTLSTSEIYVNLNQIVQRMQNACLDEENCEGDLPVKDCTSNFIIIEEKEMASIVQNQSCVFIRGPKENLTMMTDQFLFKLLGIK